jgi:hypothetical protein
MSPITILTPFLMAVLLLAPCHAENTGHNLNIQLQSDSGEAIAIGTLFLSPLEDGYRFRVEWDENRFTDQFLSMRPFQCLQGAQGMLCHLPYPYDNPRRITRDDLTDLEYDLLFIRKSTSEYGIDPWNGIYYRLRWVDDHIEGTLFETNLDVLAAPPEPGVMRPIEADMLYEADPEAHWLPTLMIGD